MPANPDRLRRCGQCRYAVVARPDGRFVCLSNRHEYSREQFDLLDAYRPPASTPAQQQERDERRAAIREHQQKENEPMAEVRSITPVSQLTAATLELERATAAEIPAANAAAWLEQGQRLIAALVKEWREAERTRQQAERGAEQLHAVLSAGGVALEPLPWGQRATAAKSKRQTPEYGTCCVCGRHFSGVQQFGKGEPNGQRRCRDAAGCAERAAARAMSS